MTDYTTPEKRIDAALDSVLKASGSALKNYTMPGPLKKMREAMRKVILEAYIKGSNDCHDALTGKDKWLKPTKQPQPAKSVAAPWNQVKQLCASWLAIVSFQAITMPAQLVQTRENLN